MNFVRSYTTAFSPTTQLKQAHLHKSKSKFIRTQESQKLDKKKVDTKVKQQERICFISPNKIKVTSQIYKELEKTPSTENLSKPNFLNQESIIQSNNVNETQKINDSLLSMYDELSQNQRKREADLFLLQKQLQSLKAILQEEKLQKNSALDKLKDFQYLQRFLLQRETYICSITEKNIAINQKLIKTEQQRQSLQKELVYLRNTYQLNLKKYQQQITDYKSRNHSLTQQNKALQQSNKQLKQHIEECYLQNNQSTTVMDSFVKQNQGKNERKCNFQGQSSSPQKKTSSRNEKQSNSILNEAYLSQKHINHTIYRELHSSRSNRLQMQRSFEYDNNQDKPFATCDRGCQCSLIVSKLNQKLRYNQIQIDILKRMKGKGEYVESDNQKLKKQIKTLTQRIEYLTDKKSQKKKRSDSPLELSLSPKKQSKNHK